MDCDKEERGERNSKEKSKEKTKEMTEGKEKVDEWP
jgi:hypothetical protein